MTLWCVLLGDRVSNQMRYLVGMGDLAGAIKLSGAIDSFNNKLRNMLQQTGGTMLLGSHEATILSIPDSIVDQIPEFVRTYNADLERQLGVGIGLNIEEASRAARRSLYSRKLELYDPANNYEDEMTKHEGSEGQVELDENDLPPNIFERPQTNSYKEMESETKPEVQLPVKSYMQKQKKPQFLPGPTAEEQGQLSQSMSQSIMQEVGFQPPPSPQQMQQQQMQPRNLLETMAGQSVPGSQTSPSLLPQKGESEEKPKEESGKDLEASVEQAEQQAEQTNQHLAQMLGNIKEQLPQIMEMQQRNPEGFKESMKMIHKLLAIASKRQKMKKNEVSEAAELTKALQDKIGRYHKVPGSVPHATLPVGTRHGNKRKVLVNGKAVWRGMGAGQVMDPKGQPLSVRLSNRNAEDNAKDTTVLKDPSK